MNKAARCAPGMLLLIGLSLPGMLGTVRCQAADNTVQLSPFSVAELDDKSFGEFADIPAVIERDHWRGAIRLTVMNGEQDSTYYVVLYRTQAGQALSATTSEVELVSWKVRGAARLKYVRKIYSGSEADDVLRAIDRSEFFSLPEVQVQRSGSVPGGDVYMVGEERRGKTINRMFRAVDASAPATALLQELSRLVADALAKEG